MMVEISKDTEKLLGAIAAIGSGFFGWEYQATAKWVAGQPQAGYSLTSVYRLKDAVCGLIGKGAAAKLFNDPTMVSRGADFNPCVLGWLNSTTFAGVGVLVVDQILKKIWPLYKNDLDAVPQIIQGVGIGLAAGGAIGGIFDPALSYATGQQAGGGAVIGGVPFMRAEGGGMSSNLMAT